MTSDRPAEPGRDTVVIVDDDPRVRGSIDSLLRSVGLHTRTCESAMELLDGGLPDGTSCIIADIRMPRIGGLELQQRLAELGHGIPLIFMTGHGDIPMSVQAMKAGAVDFLTKPFRDQDMLDAVDAALARDRARRARDEAAAALRARHDSLTPREREVMEGVVRGLLNKQIAGELGLAEITVKLHRSSMMRKMDTRSVADLVRLSEWLRQS
ncbi:response regulator transcription factor (plasmid) [Paroceanicella profunda]|uniref:Response regulator transcription factor n=1 Tax=Paroceanicella profunda TaxID=2579971 RepID=A0A5B8G5P5_9RHOB|nr:response regulator [Paroceanicella profunda]QDL94333.1 response regulator transcription factor [Paroceanicella profunda]